MPTRRTSLGAKWPQSLPDDNFCSNMDGSVSEHPPYVADFTPSDVQLLGLLKNDSGGRRFQNIAPVQ